MIASLDAPQLRSWELQPSVDLARRMAMLLLGIDLLLALSFLSLRAAGHDSEMLGLGSERSIPTWYAAMKLLVLAQVLGATAWAVWRRGRLDGPLFFLLGLVALALSIDEIAQLHEKYGLFVEPLLHGTARDELLFHRSGYWMLALGPPLAATLAALLWLVARRVRMPRSVAARALAGLAIFLLSATALEALGNFVNGYAARTLQVTAEETGEMVGITLVVWAALELMVVTARGAITGGGGRAPGPAPRT